MEEEASTNNDKLQCVFCKKYFENQPEKNLHLALWHYEKTEITNEFNNEEKVLDESVNNYPEQNDLAKKNTINNSCKFCGKIFRHSGSCNCHINTYHHGLVNFECNLCLKSFTTKRSLKRHNSTHHSRSKDAKVVKKKCDFCDSEFSQTLQRHIRQLHSSTLKSYLCDTCGKFFFEKWNLSLRIRSVHEKIKNDSNVLYVVKLIVVKIF